MACSRGKASPSATTRSRLFADSGGYCQNPECLTSLFRDIEDDVIHVAEMAHIIGASDSGPRSHPTLSEEARGAYENLILLCPTCHTIIDKAEDKFPDTTVVQWKTSHKDQIDRLFGIQTYASREDVRSAIETPLGENRTIFDTYGPESDARLDPESDMPKKWRRKVRDTVIPNNRKILALCDANRGLLSEPEKPSLELFRQHINDLEAKHIDGNPETGIRFPPKINEIFSGD